MDAVPAEAERELVRPELARVEDAEELDPAKWGSSSSRYSPAVYSRRCHGFSDFSAPAGASVRRFGVET